MLNKDSFITFMHIATSVRFATLANLSPGSKNLANFQNVWLFGFFALVKCTTCIYAHICLHIHM